MSSGVIVPESMAARADNSQSTMSNRQSCVCAATQGMKHHTRRRSYHFPTWRRGRRTELCARNQIRSTKVLTCVNWCGGLWALAQDSVRFGPTGRSWSCGTVPAQGNSRTRSIVMRLGGTVGTALEVQGQILYAVLGADSLCGLSLQQQEQSTPEPQQHLDRVREWLSPPAPRSLDRVECRSPSRTSQQAEPSGRLVTCHASVADTMNSGLSIGHTLIQYTPFSRQWSTRRRL